MVIGRGGKFYRASPRRFGISRQNLRQDGVLPFDHQLLIVATEVFALLYQGGNVGLGQEELVEPSQLRQHLQIGVIASGEM